MSRSPIRKIAIGVGCGIGLAAGYQIYKLIQFSKGLTIDPDIPRTAFVPDWVSEDETPPVSHDWVPFEDRFETFVTIPSQYEGTELGAVVDKNTQQVEIVTEDRAIATVSLPTELTGSENVSCSRDGGYLTIEVARAEEASQT